MLEALRGTASCAVRRALSVLGLLACATPLASQIRPTPPPTTLPVPIIDRNRLPMPTVDLTIQSVQVNDQLTPPSTIARVSVKNLGTADAVFPAGSVLARGDAGQAGGIAFQALTSPAQFTVPAGGSTTLTLSVGDVCNAGKAGTVTFRVDPGNVVGESNETNNAASVQAGSFATGDLQAMGVGFQTRAPAAGERTDVVIAAYPADELVSYRNVGSGPLLLCPGFVVWRETASPLSAKYGLREFKQEGTSPTLLQPTTTGMFVTKIPGAFQPGDLPPGSYPVTVLFNPDGKIRDANTSNNTSSGSVSVR